MLLLSHRHSFVISGFVVCGSLLKELEKHSDTTLCAFLSAFYSRRVKRLAPALHAAAPRVLHLRHVGARWLGQPALCVTADGLL
jgi:peptidoglycan/LPS O-acetylase OafA/YrhL